MSDLKNNLFNYATKELSQDAFICWLCSYALQDADKSDGALVECAQNLIFEFMKRGIGDDIDRNKIVLKDVEKQFEYIDVLLTVEYSGEIYKIIVEDKTHSSEHDNQLDRYKDIFNGLDVHVIGIYFKTGFQSNLSEVDRAGYKSFNRNDILAVVGECKSNNAILRSFCEFWEEFEKKATCYKSLSVKDWPDWQTVNGFYDEMQSILENQGCWCGYGNVNNPAGGFWGLWYGDDNYRIFSFENIASLYLQVETKWNYEENHYDVQLCLKLENKTGDKNAPQLTRLKEAISDCQSSFGFERPKRLRSGQHMTVGIYRMHFETSDDLKNEILGSLSSLLHMIENLNKALISNK